jgi:catechol 2,3-dioxygenase-like lactoylglutathione lyase family enzyme
MLGAQELVAFVAVTDAARSRAFYENVLGLTLIEDTPFGIVFDANGTTLRVTPVDHLEPAGYTVLGWRVDDIATSVRELAARGVSFNRYDGMGQDELGVWTAPDGDQVAWFPDPDGNTLSLTQAVGQARS